ncbi:MAG TPA: hypothetical protein VI636_02205 [Candidatus Angelobacter sp.]
MTAFATALSGRLGQRRFLVHNVQSIAVPMPNMVIQPNFGILIGEAARLLRQTSSNLQMFGSRPHYPRIGISLGFNTLAGNQKNIFYRFCEPLILQERIACLDKPEF